MNHAIEIERIVKILQKKTRSPEELIEVNEYLLNLKPLQLIMNNLSQSNKMQLLTSFNIKYFKEGERLFSKGDPSDCMFVIMTGSLQLYNHSTQDNTELIPENILGKGRILGERGILKNLPRSLTAVAREQTYMLVLDAFTFRNLLGKEVYSNIQIKRKIVDQYLPGLAHYSLTLKERLAYMLEIDIYPKGTVLAKQGSFSEKLMIILEGDCQIYAVQGLHRKTLSTLGKGSFIGEEGPLFDKPSLYSVVVISDSLKVAKMKNADVKQLFPTTTVQMLKDAYLVRDQARSKLLNFSQRSTTLNKFYTTQKNFPLASARAQEKFNGQLQRKSHRRFASIDQEINYKGILEKLRDFSSTRLANFPKRSRSPFIL